MIKKTIFILFALLLGEGASIMANVPTTVQTQFAELYGENITPYWENVDNKFVAIFQEKEGLKRAYFEVGGRWIETKLFLPQDELPDGIQTLLLNDMPDGKVLFCGKVYNHHGIWYQFDLKYSGKIVSKMVSVYGELLERQTTSYEISTETQFGEQTEQWSIPRLPSKLNALDQIE